MIILWFCSVPFLEDGCDVGFLSVQRSRMRIKRLNDDIGQQRGSSSAQILRKVAGIPLEPQSGILIYQMV